MSSATSRALSNNFQDVRLVSLASWSHAAEIQPRDAGGPYVVIQEGYDPADLTVQPGEFILGRSGRWMEVAYFYRLPLDQRRAEFVFGQAAEVMKVLGDLPSKVQVVRPGEKDLSAENQAANDDLAAAVRQRK